MGPPAGYKRFVSKTMEKLGRARSTCDFGQSSPSTPAARSSTRPKRVTRVRSGSKARFSASPATSVQSSLETELLPRFRIRDRASGQVVAVLPRSHGRERSNANDGHDRDRGQAHDHTLPRHLALTLPSRPYSGLHEFTWPFLRRVPTPAPGRTLHCPATNCSYRAR